MRFLALGCYSLMLLPGFIQGNANQVGKWSLAKKI
uniref:Uncharacterized protein n=1 Tax=Rhizophora mucronata TaxID=61149 RepID=A0A2P2MDV4_RHIMU